MADEANPVPLHVIVLPFHGQGHINPMLQFAKRLSSNGVHITFASTISTINKLESVITGGTLTSFAFQSIYDDSNQSELNALSFTDRRKKFQADASENLAGLIENLIGAGDRRRVGFVYDANLQWGLEVAKKSGIPSAAFFTQACAAIVTYYPLYLEWIGEDPATVKLPPVVPPPSLVLGGLPMGDSLRPPDAYENGKIHPILGAVLEPFKNLEQADMVLFNSFFKLEEQAVKWMETLWRVKTIGPSIPSIYLDKRLENDVNYGFNRLKSDDDACMTWLNTKKPGSVVYIAFGSLAKLSAEQMAEIAEALKHIPSGLSFLWVVRQTEEDKLPANFTSDISPHEGLVVSWCTQLDVLAHSAIGCFVSHCGWNSTIEALSLGVPMLAMPQFLDQLINAHLVEGLWGVGLRAKDDGKRFVTWQEFGRCLEAITLGERAEKMKANAAMWKALSKEAVDAGGSSEKNIDEVIAHFTS